MRPPAGRWQDGDGEKTMLIMANILGWIYAHWKWAVGVIVGIILLVVLFSVSMRIYRWFNPLPKLDEVQIQKGEQAIKDRNDAKLKDILAESDTAVENADTTIKQAEQNTEDARKTYDSWTTDELLKEFERRKALTEQEKSQ